MFNPRPFPTGAIFFANARKTCLTSWLNILEPSNKFNGDIEQAYFYSGFEHFIPRRFL